MKQKIVITLSIFYIVSSVYASEVFKVGQVPSVQYKREKLIELFNTATSQFFVQSDGGIIPIPKISVTRVRVIQVLGDNSYLARGVGYKTVHVITLKPMDVVEGETLGGYFLERGTFSYTTVLGASATNRSYFYAPNADKQLIVDKYIDSTGGTRLTQDEFLDWLKKDKELVVSRIEECRECFGSGKVSVEIGVKERCPKCRGKTEAIREYKLVW